MVGQLHKLTALKVKRLKEIGYHNDGGGLYLCIGNDGRRRWIFRYRDRQTKKLRDMGLGSAADVSLADAREKAATARSQLIQGFDPIARRQETIGRAVPTFGELADQHIAKMGANWRNPKHRAQWEMTLRIHAKPLRDKRVNAITTADVLKVLGPIWRTIPETASRVRGRIENVLDAAKVQGHRTGENPAAWRGHLKLVLPARSKLTRGHHAAMAIDDVPAFMKALRVRPEVSARCLEFTILTAARSGEALGATWDEIDLVDRVWTVPGQRMKAVKAHRVPLSDRALAILGMMETMKVGKYVFPGQRRGRPLSVMALEMVLRRMKIEGATVHGFRSSFRDWAGNRTNFPRELAEHALAHAIGDKAEQAYRREDALERRRPLMTMWSEFCAKAVGGEVIVQEVGR